MEVSDENVQTLLSMGFPCESEIRKALRLGKNDLNEAVAILTNEPPTTYDALEVEMKDEVALQGPVYGPAPPSYDEAVDTEVGVVCARVCGCHGLPPPLASPLYLPRVACI